MSQLEGETVALVAENEGKLKLYCAGVWVSRWSVLTAGHCVEDLGETPETTLMRALGVDMPPNSPIGQTALIQRRQDAERTDVAGYWTGTVVGFDKASDLGLVFVEHVPPHPWARLAYGSIWDGDSVEIVGHPFGQGWRFVNGSVMSSRFVQPNADENPMLTMQIEAPLMPGNSGGGVFDADGALIGIASYASSQAPGVGWFVHRDTLRAFLQDAGVL